MPTVDGLQLEACEPNPTIAVIMITAMSDARSAVDAMSLGAYDYVTKPFNIFELRKIKAAAERRKLILKQGVSELSGRAGTPANCGYQRSAGAIEIAIPIRLKPHLRTGCAGTRDAPPF
jgi:DNA-binding NtrC family response regulator